MNNTILVYGWYNQGNVGDELFKEAFRHLFPEYQFIFVDRITKDSLKDVAAVFIGGGSFLFAPLKIEPGAFELLKQKKLFYIGCGAETVIHDLHLELMKGAKLIAVRSTAHLDTINGINPNTLVIPDIVYCLQSSVIKESPMDRSVLIIPNTAVVPTWQDPYWKHAAWNYFKSEFAQFLDTLIDWKYSIKFLAMCQNKKTDDHHAAIEIINHMKNKESGMLLSDSLSSIEEVTQAISKYGTIVTQRFHGIVLAEMTRVPYVSLYHHDKLKHCSPGDGIFLSYYGITKAQLLSGFESAPKKFSTPIPIETNIFEGLRESVLQLINDG
jgi:polysaccharide pyruvyl transferase WcaK-like protein